MIKPSILNVSLKHSGGAVKEGTAIFGETPVPSTKIQGVITPKAEIFFAMLVNTNLLSLLASSNRHLFEM